MIQLGTTVLKRSENCHWAPTRFKWRPTRTNFSAHILAAQYRRM